MATDFTHEPSSQRRHYRMSFPIRIIIEDIVYKPKNWSIGGFSIPQFHRAVEIEETISLTVDLFFHGFHIHFQEKARVVRYDPETMEMGLELVDISERTHAILEHFSKSLISGKMTSVDEVFKQLDIPITPVSPVSKEASTNSPVLAKKQSLGRIFHLFTYIFLGLILSGLIAIITDNYILHIKVDTGIISAPMETIVAPDNGLLKEIYVTENQEIKKGDPLIWVENTQIRQDLDMARIDVQKQKTQEDYLKTLLMNEQTRLMIYKKIGKHQNAAANAGVEKAREAFKYNEAFAKRTTTLNKDGYKSDSDKELALSQAKEAENLMNQLMARAEIEKDSLKSIEDGFYYTGQKLEGVERDLQAQVKLIERQVKLSEDSFRAIENHYNSGKINAYFEGRVLRILYSINAPVPKGEALMYVERFKEKSAVIYVDQLTIPQIRLGDKVTLFVPSLEEEYKGVVLSINRSANFLNTIKSVSKYKPDQDKIQSNMIENFAEVTVSIEGIDREEVNKKLASGMPVTAYFPRGTTSRLLSKLFQRKEVKS